MAGPPTTSHAEEAGTDPEPKIGWCSYKIVCTVKGKTCGVKRKTIIKTSVGLLFFIAILATIYALMKTGLFQTTLEWIRGIGIWGHVMMGCLFLVGCMPFTTGWSIVAMACGLIYGMGIGLVTNMVSTFIGTFICFFLCRLLLKNWLRRKIDNSKKLSILFKAVDRHAVKFIVLIRLTPLPLGMATALCAVTRVRFYVFFPVSFAVQMIHITLWTFMGTGITSITDLVNGKAMPPAQIGILIGGIGVVLIMFALGVFVGRRALIAAKKEQQEEEAAAATAAAAAAPDPTSATVPSSSASDLTAQTSSASEEVPAVVEPDISESKSKKRDSMEESSGSCCSSSDSSSSSSSRSHSHSPSSSSVMTAPSRSKSVAFETSESSA